MHVRVRTWACVCARASLRAYMGVSLFLCMCLCMHVRECLHAHVWMCACVHTDRCVGACMCVCVHMRGHACVAGLKCACVCADMYVYACIHMHVSVHIFVSEVSLNCCKWYLPQLLWTVELLYRECSIPPAAGVPGERVGSSAKHWDETTGVTLLGEPAEPAVELHLLEREKASKIYITTWTRHINLMYRFYCKILQKYFQMRNNKYYKSVYSFCTAFDT